MVDWLFVPNRESAIVNSPPMPLRWKHCRIRERFSSGPAERGGPAWWVELALDAEATAPAWNRLTARLQEALAADQQPAVAEALDLGDDPEPSTLSQWCLALARALLAPWPVEELPPLWGEGLVARSGWHGLLGEALQLCRRLIEAAAGEADPADPGLANALTRFRQRVLELQRDTLSSGVVHEAQRRGIAVSLLSEGLPPSGLLQLGTGSRSRILRYSMVEADSALGSSVCANKLLSHQLLQRLGIPVPRQVSVAVDADTPELQQALDQVGEPCVVKPPSQEQGRGVTLGIRGLEALRRAIGKAARFGDASVLVQQQCSGIYYRLVVLNQRLVRVVQSQPPYVIGDGQRSIAALLDQANGERLQQPSPPGMPQAIRAARLDASARQQLSLQGWTPDSCPAVGQKLVIGAVNPERRSAWVQQELWPRDLHPSFAAMATAVAKTLGMVNLGIDVLSDDIRMPLQSPGHAVLELNHNQTLFSAGELLESLFPDQAPAHIPINLVVLADAQDWRSRWLERGVSSHTTVFSPQVAQWLEGQEDLSGVLRYDHPSALLSNRAIDGLSWVISWPELVDQGLPCPGIHRILLPPSEPSDLMERQWRQLLIAERAAIPRRF